VRPLIFLLDRLLRRAYGIFEFSNEPTCVLRLRVKRVPRALPLPGGQIPAGATVLELHLWNEHIPPLPKEGPDLVWAVQARRQLIASLRAVAQELRHNERLAQAQAIGGVTVLISASGPQGGEELVSRMGFTVVPCHRPLGRFGEFWENLYTWGLMWAFGAVSLRRRRFLGLRRVELWISREEFLCRYGDI